MYYFKSPTNAAEDQKGASMSIASRCLKATLEELGGYVGYWVPFYSERVITYSADYSLTIGRTGPVGLSSSISLCGHAD